MNVGIYLPKAAIKALPALFMMKCAQDSLQNKEMWEEIKSRGGGGGEKISVAFPRSSVAF